MAFKLSIFEPLITVNLFLICNAFQKKYCIKDIDDGSLKVIDDLNLKIKPFILRRKKSDVLVDLPDKLINNIYIDFIFSW